MSTRSVIAVKTGENTYGEPTFLGVYCHSDGYLGGVGAKLYELWNGHFKGRGQELADTILAHKAGWSSIYGDWNLPIGFVERRTNLDDTYGPVCYCHGDRHEDAQDYYTEADTEFETCLYLIDVENALIRCKFTYFEPYVIYLNGPHIDFEAEEQRLERRLVKAR